MAASVTFAASLAGSGVEEEEADERESAEKAVRCVECMRLRSLGVVLCHLCVLQCVAVCCSVLQCVFATSVI